MRFPDKAFRTKVGAPGFRHWKAWFLIFKGNVVVTEKLHTEDKDKETHWLCSAAESQRMGDYVATVTLKLRSVATLTSKT
jgi:hypothetical protein